MNPPWGGVARSARRNLAERSSGLAQSPQCCFRLARPLAVEIHETWLEAPCSIKMGHVREHKKESSRALAA